MNIMSFGIVFMYDSDIDTGWLLQFIIRVVK